MSESNLPLTPAAELFGRPIARRYCTVGPLPILRAVLRIRSLTESERQAWEAQGIGKKFERVPARVADAQRRLFQLVLVDESGNPYVTAEQRDEMASWDSADTAYLYEEVARHCGLNRSALEALRKNSETTLDDDSP